MIKKMRKIIIALLCTFLFSFKVHKAPFNTVQFNGYVNKKQYKTINAFLDVAKNIGVKEITMIFYSGGGYVYWGNRIIKSMKRSKIKFTCIAYRAHSMALMIFLQGCHKRLILHDGLLMHHAVKDQNCRRGNKETEKHNKIIARETKVPLYIVRKQIGTCHKEWWIDAEEALHYGFVEGIIKKLEIVDK